MERWVLGGEEKRLTRLEPPAKRSGIFVDFFFYSNRSIKSSDRFGLFYFCLCSAVRSWRWPVVQPLSGLRSGSHLIELIPTLSSAQLSQRSQRNSTDWPGFISRYVCISRRWGFIRQLLFCNPFCNFHYNNAV